MATFPYMILLLCWAVAAVTLAGEPTKKEDADLGFAIMGAIVQKNSEDSVALIKEESGTVRAVKRDHVIMDKYKVVAVAEHTLELVDREAKHFIVYQGKFAGDNGGKMVAANLPITGSADRYHEDGFERDGGKIAVTGAYRDKLVKDDLARVLMQATAEPYMENGMIAGFKMSQVDDGSIYAKSGVVNGDLITAINGTELNSIAGSIALLRTLKAADHIDIEIKRNGAPQHLSIDIH